jgi:hypothetical protein
MFLVCGMKCLVVCTEHAFLEYVMVVVNMFL